MTHQELFKLHGLKGRLQGRASCLEADIRATINLVSILETEFYQSRFRGQLDILKQWEHSNTHLLEEVTRIIKEAENARE